MEPLQWFSLVSGCFYNAAFAVWLLISPHGMVTTLNLPNSYGEMGDEAYEIIAFCLLYIALCSAVISTDAGLCRMALRYFGCTLCPLFLWQAYRNGAWLIVYIDGAMMVLLLYFGFAGGESNGKKQ